MNTLLYILSFFLQSQPFRSRPLAFQASLFLASLLATPTHSSPLSILRHSHIALPPSGETVARHERLDHLCSLAQLSSATNLPVGLAVLVSRPERELRVDHRSRTGLLDCCNSSLSIWYVSDCGGLGCAHFCVAREAGFGASDEVAGLLLDVCFGHLVGDSAEFAAGDAVYGCWELLVLIEDDADVLALGVARWVAVVADVAWLCGVDCVIAALLGGCC